MYFLKSFSFSNLVVLLFTIYIYHSRIWIFYTYFVLGKQSGTKAMSKQLLLIPKHQIPLARRCIISLSNQFP